MENKIVDSLPENWRDEFYAKDIVPKGWVSIEDHLPRCIGVDIFDGGTLYLIKFSDGYGGTSRVADHDMWYYRAKEVGVTHWWNPPINYYISETSRKNFKVKTSDGKVYYGFTTKESAEIFRHKKIISLCTY